jgi:ABC-type branched-subunit amino acid transport system ATPase component
VATTADILRAEGITVRFGGLVALTDVSISVAHGSIVGLIGPNGAGKSTLFAVLSGLLTPASGTVLLRERDVTSASPQQRARRGMARTFQHPALFDSLTVREHIVLADRMHRSRSRLWRDVLTFASLRGGNREESLRVTQTLELLGLRSIADRPVVGLPLGTCRLVELGRALATEPVVILLDEPASGLDTDERRLLADALRMINTEHRASLLLVEHDLDFVMRLSHEVHVLDFGVRIASGAPEEIRQDPGVRSAYMGDDIVTEEVTP